ncbi:MAG: hypothetical protein WC614_01605 [bacterium]
MEEPREEQIHLEILELKENHPELFSQEVFNSLIKEISIKESSIKAYITLFFGFIYVYNDKNKLSKEKQDLRTEDIWRIFKLFVSLNKSEQYCELSRTILFEEKDKLHPGVQSHCIRAANLFHKINSVNIDGIGVIECLFEGSVKEMLEKSRSHEKAKKFFYELCYQEILHYKMLKFQLIKCFKNDFLYKIGKDEIENILVQLFLGGSEEVKIKEPIVGQEKGKLKLERYEWHNVTKTHRDAAENILSSYKEFVKEIIKTYRYISLESRKIPIKDKNIYGGRPASGMSFKKSLYDLVELLKSLKTGKVYESVLLCLIFYGTDSFEEFRNDTMDAETLIKQIENNTGEYSLDAKGKNIFDNQDEPVRSYFWTCRETIRKKVTEYRKFVRETPLPQKENLTINIP